VSIIVAVSNHLGMAIGSDSRAVFDSGMIVADGVQKVKVDHEGGYAIGACGSLGAAQRALASLVPLGSEHGALRFGGEVPSEASGAVALRTGKRSGQLWTFCADGSTVKHNRPFVCVGAGDAYAMAAIDTAIALLPKSKQDPAALVRIGLKAACKFNNTCGGKLQVYTL